MQVSRISTKESKQEKVLPHVNHLVVPFSTHAGGAPGAPGMYGVVGQVTTVFGPVLCIFVYSNTEIL